MARKKQTARKSTDPVNNKHLREAADKRLNDTVEAAEIALQALEAEEGLVDDDDDDVDDDDDDDDDEEEEERRRQQQRKAKAAAKAAAAAAAADASE